MAWATQADLNNRYGSTVIADLVTGGASVSEALADAEAEAESYVSVAVELPFTSVPDSIKRIVCTIARYNLWRRDLGEDHPVYIAYKDALRELRAISVGEVRLVADVAPTISPAATPGTRVNVFTSTVLELMP